MKIITIVFSMVLLISSKLSAKVIPLEGYDYPYKVPIRSTSTWALVKSRETLKKPIFLQIPDLDGRGNVKYVEGRDRAEVYFYKQKKARKKPLMILYPGTGATPYSRGAKWMAEEFYLAGFNVLVLPSVLNWKFVLTSSTTGYPGLVQNDIPDLLRLTKKALIRIELTYGLKWDKVHLSGYSLGAYHAAFMVARFGELFSGLGLRINKTILINPPVEIVASLTRLASLTDVAKNWSRKKRNRALDTVVSHIIGYVDKDINHPDYFKDLRKKFNFSDSYLKFGIGTMFQTTAGEALFISQGIDDMGVLKTPLSEKYPAKRLNEAIKHGLMGYLNNALIPWIHRECHRTNCPGVDIEKVFAENSFYAIKDELKNNENIFVLHNEDDIIMNKKEIQFLNETFGERAWIFPAGGHMGNMWFKKNLEVLHRLLK